jgi:CO/xanthine dehydrogenase Mo-binding subunit
VEVVGSPGTRRPLAALDGLRGEGEQVYGGGLDPDTGQGVASTHWHQGAAAVEVDVDPETGIVEVLRAHAAIYAGHVVSRPHAELQNEGSMIMGLGSALFEAIDWADGQVTNANLSDYQLPSMLDVPAAMTHELLERDGAEVHGLGETALPVIPAALANALATLGARVHHLPVSAEAVLDALDAREGG